MSVFVVTGAAGFIGSHLAEALLSSGHQVVGVDAFTDHYSRATKKRNLERIAATRGWRLLEIDLSSDPLDALVARCDGIFHLAGEPGVRDSWGQRFDRYLRNNIHATKRIADAALRARKRLVFTSSSSVYGESAVSETSGRTLPRPISPYGVTKLACEQLIQALETEGLEAVILRLFTVYGPRQRPDMAVTRMLKALYNDGEFEIFGDGHQAREWTYVGDLVAAAILAMDVAPNAHTYDVGGGTSASLLEIAHTLEAVTGLALRVRHAAPAAGDMRHAVSDSSALRERGWLPAVPLCDGLAAQAQWIRDELEVLRA